MKYDLCGKCAHELREAFELKPLARAVDEKIVCAHCKRKRYGGKYELLPKRGAEK